MPQPEQGLMPRLVEKRKQREKKEMSQKIIELGLPSGWSHVGNEKTAHCIFAETVTGYECESKEAAIRCAWHHVLMPLGIEVEDWIYMQEAAERCKAADELVDPPEIYFAHDKIRLAYTQMEAELAVCKEALNKSDSDLEKLAVGITHSMEGVKKWLSEKDEEIEMLREHLSHGVSLASTLINILKRRAEAGGMNLDEMETISAAVKDAEKFIANSKEPAMKEDAEPEEEKSSDADEEYERELRERLEKLHFALEHAGGRGIELADEIDEIRRELGEAEY